MAKNKAFKVGILVSTLLIPALIYLFLRTFGSNEYSSLPQLGKVPDTTSTDLKDSLAFVFPWENVSLSPLSGNGEVKKEGNLKLLHFIDPTKDNAYETTSQISRLREYIKENENVFIMSIASDSHKKDKMDYFASSFLPGDNWSFYFSSELELLSDTLSSRFDIDKSIFDYTWLVGPNQYVRGVYNVKDPDKMDKLIEDIMVLRKKEL